MCDFLEKFKISEAVCYWKLTHFFLDVQTRLAALCL